MRPSASFPALPSKFSCMWSTFWCLSFVQSPTEIHRLRKKYMMTSLLYPSPPTPRSQMRVPQVQVQASRWPLWYVLIYTRLTTIFYIEPVMKDSLSNSVAEGEYMLSKFIRYFITLQNLMSHNHLRDWHPPTNFLLCLLQLIRQARISLATHGLLHFPRWQTSSVVFVVALMLLLPSPLSHFQNLPIHRYFNVILRQRMPRLVKKRPNKEFPLTMTVLLCLVLDKVR